MQRATFESEFCSVNRYQPPNKMKTMSSGKTNRRNILFRSLSRPMENNRIFLCFVSRYHKKQLKHIRKQVLFFIIAGMLCIM